ncbi:UDP-N-acetylglucosamine--LPS N-acetylglucosamine transferase [Kocuria sp. WRN011]|uniref:PssD/Cps14F family polysaccharide biosynthesis glycosyltransferase n=1 Tax=Kocuria carniphila TaxID=262208 RepID=A0ABV3V1U4_9MICC|nr:MULTISPECIES: PssD/Cps14F family polysaccharide biosynthesis glycosyltransferase [Kocuria]MCT1801279.1 UDP-N-acetylglucosamine transferase subunit ALG14 [Kocuria carniphila]PBB08336.1 UDP-N-acetylglucosamine--LPS N-acetylglucosamine transferase [Kocuria sp. WRN011]PZP33061.1 MAG: UDP-N-acetylglucosamine--LPS N-acetylglucosamine transferase [Kocuria rhizophila]
MKILLVASAGGHLAQLQNLQKLWEDHERSWVTFDLPEVRAGLHGEDLHWAHFPTTRNIPNAIRNLGVARKLIRELKPDVVMSTGAAVAVPFFLVARRRRIRTVFIECFDRITMPTMSGRMCYPLSDVFAVQWDEQKRHFPDAVNIGALM